MYTTIHSALLMWYDQHRRVLPWRAPSGGVPNPYHVYLSEVMLQQTTVATVCGYFNQFIAKWPTVSDLAAASLDEILVAWQGLGYYRRARHLHETVRKVAALPEWPQTVAALKQLPGVGDYTAAAVAAIAFNQPTVPVDGNVMRVMARLEGLTGTMPTLKKGVIKRVQPFAELGRAGDFAQALMDLGATICRPQNPTCVQCPLRQNCYAYAHHAQAMLPTRAAKAAKPTRYGAAFVMANPQGEILLRRRPHTGLLAGMIEVPGTEWTEGPIRLPSFAQQWLPLTPSVHHTFTHFHLHLTVYYRCLADYVPKEGEFWAAPTQFPRYALPTVMKKVLAATRRVWYSHNNGENI